MTGSIDITGSIDLTGATGATGTDPRWVAFVTGADRAGTLTALTNVFSTRGVNFESLSAASVEGDAGLIVVTFVASERRRRLLIRTVERLAVVRSVEVHAADDTAVRAAGVVQLPRGDEFAPPTGVDVRWSGDSRSGRPVLVEGTLADVERVVSDVRAHGALAAAMVILPPVGAPPT